jgi:acyl-CoA thioester hydrolase
MTTKQHSYFHSTPIQIRVNDIDPLNHVNNSVYQQYFDLGKIAYFDRVLGEHLNLEAEGLVLASITIEYLKPITLYDSIEVLTRIYEMGTKSLKMGQEIVNRASKEVYTTSKSVLVCFSNAIGQSIPIPLDWRERISSFEKDLIQGVNLQ